MRIRPQKEAELRLRGTVSVEMEKGIVTTAAFHGDAIEIENGIGLKPNLRLKSTYIFLSKILGG